MQLLNRALNVAARRVCQLPIQTQARALSVLSSTKEQRNWSKWVFGLGCGATIAGATATTLAFAEEQAFTPPERPDLPTVSLAEVQTHNSMDKRIWVTWQGGVYDVTDFVEQHPGGNKILLASGGSLEPFWSLYRQHLTPEVQATLEQYRVANLSPEDLAMNKKSFDENDPYRNDPERHPALVVHKNKPFNAEVPNSLITNEYITPSGLYYVRHHHPVPVVDPAEYRLTVEGKGIKKPIELTLSDIKNKFPAHEITMTMQCGGNRRSELDKAGKTQGLKWHGGAISTATWRGARLRDVLKYAGLSEEAARRACVNYINCYPLDPPYDASVPVKKAFDADGDVILAYEMNGETLPRDHGYPIRCVVPGYIGARSVKWVTRIEASEKESPSTWQVGIPYKACSPSIKKFTEDLDVTSLPSVNDLPVQSYITNPTEELIVEPDEESVTVQGYAWSGNGRKIVRVDVSADGGHTWVTADLVQGSEQPDGQAWAWTLWEAEVPVPESCINKKRLNLVCKAVDSSFNQQPEKVTSVWSLRGILNNAWHHVRIRVEPKKNTYNND